MEARFSSIGWEMAKSSGANMFKCREYVRKLLRESSGVINGWHIELGAEWPSENAFIYDITHETLTRDEVKKTIIKLRRKYGSF